MTEGEATADMLAAWINYEFPKTAGAQTTRAATLQRHAFYAGWLAAVAAGKWHPIETAPKDGSLVLVAGVENGGVVTSNMTVARWLKPYGWGSMPFGGLFEGATHWMPLPEPPK